ncbi:MAG: hypothetical protein Q7R79_04545 [bacterium]|nr:hypothetical protein [bacterium]
MNIHQRPFFIVSLAIVFAIVSIGIQSMFSLPIGEDGIRISFIDSNAFNYAQIIFAFIGLVVGAFGLIKPPSTIKDVWWASFLGYVIYMISQAIFYGSVSNIWPLALISLAFMSLLPFGFAFLGIHVRKFFSPRPQDPLSSSLKK